MADRTFNTQNSGTAAAVEFIPEVIHAGIEKNLNAKWVFVDGCNRSYEGDIKRKGDTVKIRTVGRITAHSLARSAARTSIEAAEELEGDMLTLPIDQILYTNCKVDSIDELATDVSLVNATSDEMATALADGHDQYVAALVDTATNSVTDDLNASWSLTPNNITDMLLKARTALKKKNIPDSAVLEFIGTPEIEACLIKAGILTKTRNDEMYANGNVGKTLGINIKVSNNVFHNSTSNYDACCLRVRDKAMAFAQQVSKVIRYREDGDELDADFLKSYSLFGAKVLFNDYMVKIPVASVTLDVTP